MKKNIVILILTAVCLFEFVFVLTASRENSFSGENDISEGNAREEEAKEGAGFDVTVNPDDPRLANPESMVGTIAELCMEKSGRRPASDAETVACIFRSLAFRYGEVLEDLKRLAPFGIDSLYIIGGGVRNRLLNAMTGEVTGVRIMEGPAEATAIGNCMLQAKAAGRFADRWDYRRAIASLSIRPSTL